MESLIRNSVALFLIFSLLAPFVFLTPARAASSVEDAVADREAELRKELEALEAEMENLKKTQDGLKREGVSLERDIAILNAKIEQARLNIRAKNLRIGELSSSIDKKTATIGDLEHRIERGKESLAELVRQTNEIDSYSMLEIVLSNEDFSEFFLDLDSYLTIKDSLRSLFEDIRAARDQTAAERESLSVVRKQEIDARVEIENQRRLVERSEKEKKELLTVNTKTQKTYDQVLKDREKRAAQIRSALFSLRDTAAIPFGQALDLATRASERTGVRAAFILAILTQESNLGENVGTCNRPGDTKTWRDIMPGPDDGSWRDDQTVFIELMNELGFSTDGMPLSCPWGGGWGGAMGPSQFIPTTWKAYKNRIAKVTGNNPPNPWNPGDAIAATALYLADLGADKGGFSAEQEAALRYYAGSNWNKPANAFYGRQVMAHAQNIQENMIDPLQNY